MINKLRKNKALLAFIGLFAIIVFGFGFAIYNIAEGIESYTLPSGSIEVSTEYSSYTTGEVVKAGIKNNLNTTIYINNECPDEPLNVYYFENEKWVPVHESTSEASCPNKDRQIAIKPNSSGTVSYQEWGKLFAKPGKYRILAAASGFRSYPYQDIVVSSPVVALPKPTITQNTRPTPTINRTPTATPTKPKPSPTPEPTERDEDDD